MYKEPKLVYAINEKGELTHINEVPNGNHCGCYCPGCGGELIARNLGKKQQHHFAHQSGENCQTGYETSLHLLAKDILSKAKAITLPEVYLNLNNEKRLLSEAKQIQIDSVELEKVDKNEENIIVPDVIITDKESGKTIFIEIRVTHPIDNQKLEKIKQRNISTVEIDLRKIEIKENNGTTTPLEQLYAKDKEIFELELKKHVLGKSDNKYWAFNSYANNYIENITERIIQILNVRKCIHLPTLFVFSKLSFIFKQLNYFEETHWHTQPAYLEDIIDHNDKIQIFINRFGYGLDTLRFKRLNNIIINNSKYIAIKKAEIIKEHTVNCPEILITTEQNKEIYLTLTFQYDLHGKYFKFAEKRKILTLNIFFDNLSTHTATVTNLSKLLLTDCKQKTWLFHPQEAYLTNQIYRIAHGSVSMTWFYKEPPKVKKCPHKKATSSYLNNASVFKECANCPYCIYILRDEAVYFRYHVLCLGNIDLVISDFQKIRAFLKNNPRYFGKKEQRDEWYENEYGDKVVYNTCTFYYPDNPDVDYCCREKSDEELYPD